MADAARAAAAALDVALQCYARHVPKGKTRETFEIIQAALTEELNISPIAASLAVSVAMSAKAAELRNELRSK